jgi:hypothetical protein
MNRKTAKALEGSIKKWEAIVAGTAGDKGDDNCPLCKLFLWLQDCEGCPVKEKTGRMSCEGSPYDRWLNMEWSYDQRADTPERKLAAKAMLKFLESLR